MSDLDKLSDDELRGRMAEGLRELSKYTGLSCEQLLERMAKTVTNDGVVSDCEVERALLEFTVEHFVTHGEPAKDADSATHEAWRLAVAAIRSGQCVGRIIDNAVHFKFGGNPNPVHTYEAWSPSDYIELLHTDPRPHWSQVPQRPDYEAAMERARRCPAWEDEQHDEQQ